VSRVLIVDDDPGIVDVVSYALRNEGFEAEGVASGEEALSAARTDSYDLMILDLMMPGMSGLEVCRRLRAESKIPIVMLTAKDAELDRVLGLEIGADDYVTKPFSLRELTARIRALFRRSEAAVATSVPPAVIDLGLVQADLAGHRLLRDGEAVPLKPKAFELLAFLVRHDYAGETRTVDVHVHWLRSQIEADPAKPAFIHTVRGVGYVFRRPT
jgi:two-component system, OmpR family, response regulator RegX3